MENLSSQLDRLDALEKEATPVNWQWARENDTTKPILVSRPKYLIVMDFVRRGMQSATFRLARRSQSDLGGILFEPTVDEAREHPDGALIAELRNAWPSISSQVRALIAQRDALLLQAECQAQEMRAQRSIVRDVYQLCTGSTGEPGDWNGAEPVRALIEERDALREALKAAKIGHSGDCRKTISQRAGLECSGLPDCGMAEHNAAIDAALSRSKEEPRA